MRSYYLKIKGYGLFILIILTLHLLGLINEEGFVLHKFIYLILFWVGYGGVMFVLNRHWK
jgi:hypothetical protein